MEAVTRLCLFLAVSACGAKPPAPPSTRADPVPVADAPPAPPAPRAEVFPAPQECGKRTWRRCLSLAESLLKRDRTYHPQAVRIYKLLCGEGDRRGCFEDDRPADVAEQCREDGLVAACYELSHLYRQGKATCPDDDACADLLSTMACHGGEVAACLD